jgi:hypothetical protein
MKVTNTRVIVLAIVIILLLTVSVTVTVTVILFFIGLIQCYCSLKGKKRIGILLLVIYSILLRVTVKPMVSFLLVTV